jgi:hypothetical protein
MANTGAVTIANTAVENAMVATGIDAAKLADGSVSNAEFQYINSLSSNAQTQLDAKAVLTGSTNNTITTVTGANAITVEANLTYDGTTLGVKNAGTASDIKVYCESSNSHYTSIKSAAHSAYTGGSWTLTLPGTDGGADQFLKTNGSGVTSWADVPAGAPTGAGTEKVFYENENSVDASYTLTTNFNAVSAGPVTVASGVTVTIPAGQAWVIV